jgi:hypothetical protein
VDNPAEILVNGALLQIMKVASHVLCHEFDYLLFLVSMILTGGCFHVFDCENLAVAQNYF